MHQTWAVPWDDENRDEFLFSTNSSIISSAYIFSHLVDKGITKKDRFLTFVNCLDLNFL